MTPSEIQYPNMPQLPNPLRSKTRYRSDEASAYLAAVHGLTFATRTLDKLRSIGGGPRYSKVNRSCLYHFADLDEWALAKLGDTKANTSDTGGDDE